MDGIKPNIASVGTYVKPPRFAEHDNYEDQIMDLVRPFTDRKHLPDRWVSFAGVLCPFDVKTTIFCEDKSHNEYQRLSDSGYGMWIVYRDKNEPDIWYADWFKTLSWSGPYPPSYKSRSGDPYYTISGGRLS